MFRDKSPPRMHHSIDLGDANKAGTRGLEKSRTATDLDLSSSDRHGNIPNPLHVAASTPADLIANVKDPWCSCLVKPNECLSAIRYMFRPQNVQTDRIAA